MLIFTAIVLIVFGSACTLKETPTPTGTLTHTYTPGHTPTRAPTQIATATEISSLTLTYTTTPSITPSVTPSRTATPTLTDTLTMEATLTITPNPTLTIVPSTQRSQILSMGRFDPNGIDVYPTALQVNANLTATAYSNNPIRTNQTIYLNGTPVPSPTSDLFIFDLTIQP